MHSPETSRRKERAGARRRPTEEIISGEKIGIVDSNDDAWRDFLHGVAHLKDGILRFEGDLLLDVEIVEIEHESPVEIPFARHRPVVNVGLLTVDVLAQDPRFDVDVRRFLSGDEVLVVQFDVRRVPDRQPELIGNRLERCDINGRTRRRPRHGKEVQPHLQLALLRVRKVRIEQRARFDVFGDQC